VERHASVETVSLDHCLAARLAVVAMVLDLPNLAADIVTSITGHLPPDLHRPAARALEAIRRPAESEGIGQERPVWRD
jgi:hypothetical protein